MVVHLFLNNNKALDFLPINSIKNGGITKPDVKVNSIYDIGTANYSWASHKIKSTPRLEEKFLSLLKAKTPEQRKQISYENFKKEYCD